MRSIGKLTLCGAVGAVALAATASAQTPFDETSPWAIIGGPLTRKARLATQPGARIDGSVCTGDAALGGGTVVDGDIVVTGSTVMRATSVRANALVTGDIVTAGRPIRSRPRSQDLPGIFSPLVPAGTVVPRTDGSGIYDTTGSDPRLVACLSARVSLFPILTTVDALPSQRNLGPIRIPARRTATIDARLSGGVNVVDISAFRLGRAARIVLDGGGDASTVMVLRIAERIRMRLASQIVATGGLDASNVLIVSEGEACRVGDRASGVGTLACPHGRIALQVAAEWQGALFGGGQRTVALGRNTSVVGVPFAGF